MRGYINRILGRGHQPTKTVKEVGPPPGSKKSVLLDEYSFSQYADPVFNKSLFNSRMELLTFLTKENNGGADKEIDDLIQALMEQVNVYHPPDKYKNAVPVDSIKVEKGWGE